MDTISGVTAPRRTIRVFLVEDHETVREGLRLLVSAQSDMQVVGEAGDGRTAVDAIAATTPDVVVLDLTMPGMTGLATAKALQTSPPSTAVVVLTRHDDRAFVQELIAAGAAGYVLKQSPSSELLRAVRAAAAGGRYMDPSLPLPTEPVDPKRRDATPRASKREVQVLRLSARGHSNKEIAARLGIGIKTVEVHKANAMRKLNLSGRADLVRYAMMSGWLERS